MAKTFKNLPRPSQPTVAKPTSERDFFDLSDVPEVVKKGSGKSKEKGNTDNTSNINNISNSGNTSNISISTDLNSSPESAATILATTQDSVRQTFVLSREHLEQLRDYVHSRRAQGDYMYSQKQALQQALELLFASDSPAPPRPAHTREQEKERRQRIRQGRRSQSSEQPD